jgi:hypothetical protein
MTRPWGEPRAFESVRPPLSPLYISVALYQAIRKARPDVDWDAFGPDITIRRNDRGQEYVRIVEDTKAASAIREAMDALENL